MNDCFICRKHRELEKFTGDVLMEADGLMLTHFPLLDDEKTTRGHLLIEPRRHIVSLSEMTDAEAAALGVIARRAESALKSVLGVEHVYVFRLNDKVAHLHFHLVPRYPGTPREYWGMKVNEWPGRPILNLDQIKETARELKKGF